MQKKSNALNVLLARLRQTGLNKNAFQPMPTGDPSMAGAGQMPQGDPTMGQAGGGAPAGAGMPMDPSMMQQGQPPMDPSMQGGMPMDPSMQGMPMDPSQGGMPTMDPSMMEAAEPMVGDMTVTELKDMFREVLSDVLVNGGKPEEMSDRKGESGKDLAAAVQALAEKVDSGFAALGLGGDSQQAPDVGAYGAGAGSPVQLPPELSGQGAQGQQAPMTVQASSSHNTFADFILSRTKGK